ncbi:MAG: LLM class flavin-dependent oxidoreductase [Paracoccaceae bacterium]
MIPYSLLDLSPVPAGHTPADALRNTVDLARHAEDLGYTRYWLAEHHNMRGIASAATAVLIGQVAAHTKTIRVGAGGIMLPNHAPLMVAEAFGTLATMYPDRIDLGLGRAPGTDMLTARALRHAHDDGSGFPRDVAELIGYLGDPNEAAKVRAVPGEGTHVPVWILGSSLFGAQLAAALGLPYAFASHFAPAALEEAFYIYRRDFRPSKQLDAPHAMMALNVFGAQGDAEAQLLRSSMQQAFINLRSGRPGPLPRPDADFAKGIDPRILAGVEQALACTACGTPQMVQSQLAQLIETFRPDEVIITGQIHDHTARKASFAIAAQAMRALA